MSARHVVVDGSNIATEGRSLPSLAQLDQAVREFMGENPDDVITVVVDASFGHRINEEEVTEFEAAELAREVVSPPAGAIGRGDAFLLRIAEKVGATVLSNDSFQEFHGEHSWLFERGRLIGGKPVPGVGWIFTDRTPVRGPKSREAVKEAKRKRREDEAATGLGAAAERAKGKGKGGKKVERAIARATEEAVEPENAKRKRRRRDGVPPAEPVNEPLTFITFIAEHPLGSQVTGTVDSFSSHGAFVIAKGARCYLPLSAMADPPPKAAREVFSKGDDGAFVVQALDPPRRGIELAVPGFENVAGAPTEETIEAEISPDTEADAATEAIAEAVAAASPGVSESTAVDSNGSLAPPVGEPSDAEPAKAAKKASATKKSTAKKAPAKKAPAKKAATKKAPAARKAAADKTAAKKPPAEKAASTKKAPAAKKATATKASAAKKAAAAPGKKEPAKKAASTADKKEPAKKAAKKRAPAKKAAAKAAATVGEPAGAA